MHLPSLDAKAALVIAHPSHELRVHGWLQLARPRVFVMTDGSGRSSQARLPSTTRVLAEAGAEPGSMYGRITDLELYVAILDQKVDLFIELADGLADAFSREQIDYVVGDAAEGYSPAHDVCRLLVNAAVTMTRLKYKRHVSNFDFLVVSSPDEDPDTRVDDVIRIHLDDDMFSRKVAAAHDYSPKLAADIDAALRGEKFQGVNRLFEPQIAGQVDVEVVQTVLTALKSQSELEAKFKALLGGVELDAFRTECLRPISDHDSASDMNEAPPFYELYGEKLVAAGRYKQAISYRDHIRPLADALLKHVDKERLKRVAHSNHE